MPGVVTLVVLPVVPQVRSFGSCRESGIGGQNPGDTLPSSFGQAKHAKAQRICDTFHTNVPN